MSESLVVALVVAVASLFVNLWITSINIRNQRGIAVEAQKEARRTKRYEYLLVQMESLLDASKRFHSFIGKPLDYRHDDLGQHELASIVGQAINACLSTSDEHLLIIGLGDQAGNGLTPYRLKDGENGSNGDYLNRNRRAFVEAVKRMAELVADAGK